MGSANLVTMMDENAGAFVVQCFYFCVVIRNSLYDKVERYLSTNDIVTDA